MILVIDVGTTSLRAALVDHDGAIRDVEQVPFPPNSPAPGLVEFDALELSDKVLGAARAVMSRAPAVEAVGVTTQRASTVVWDRRSGQPIGPALGWQDLRTVAECLVARAEHDVEVAPNQTATKVGWLLANHTADEGRRLPDEHVCIGTIDTWVVWTLSQGAHHVTDHTNAAVTGLYDITRANWSDDRCRVFDVQRHWLAELVDSTGEIGSASALPGAPPIVALVGDQQASLIGQGCLRPGQAKITFGTGGMLDLVVGEDPPASGQRSADGTFPIITWSEAGRVTWGVEAIMLSAGSNVDWLRDDLGMLETSAQSHDIAAACSDSGGVMYVPALLGLGTPKWDYGARGTLVGITRGTNRAQIVRAVLEGIAHRGADLVEAAETHTGISIPALRVDGGMSENPTFIQALANTTGKPIDVSSEVEATTLGAAALAAVAVGQVGSLSATAERWRPAVTVEPTASADRERWAEAVQRAAGWIPELSALDF